MDPSASDRKWVLLYDSFYGFQIKHGVTDRYPVDVLAVSVEVAKYFTVLYRTFFQNEKNTMVLKEAVFDHFDSNLLCDLFTRPVRSSPKQQINV